MKISVWHLITKRHKCHYKGLCAERDLFGYCKRQDICLLDKISKDNLIRYGSADL